MSSAPWPEGFRPIPTRSGWSAFVMEAARHEVSHEILAIAQIWHERDRVLAQDNLLGAVASAQQMAPHWILFRAIEIELPHFHSLRLSSAAADFFRTLAGLTVLRGSHDRVRVDPSRAAAVFEALPAIRDLRVDDTMVGATGLARLLEAAPPLATLSARRCGLRPGAAIRCLSWPATASLRSLDLSENGVGIRDVAQISQTKAALVLRNLRFEDNHSAASDASRVAFPALEALHIDRSDLLYAPPFAATTSWDLPVLRSLSATGCFIDLEALDGWSVPSIERVCLAQAEIRCADSAPIATVRSRLRSLLSRWRSPEVDSSGAQVADADHTERLSP